MDPLRPPPPPPPPPPPWEEEVWVCGEGEEEGGGVTEVLHLGRRS